MDVQGDEVLGKFCVYLSMKETFTKALVSAVDEESEGADTMQQVYKVAGDTIAKLCSGFGA
jgi:hypothetical protein